jgi:hypothetical protein
MNTLTALSSSPMVAMAGSLQAQLALLCRVIALESFSCGPLLGLDVAGLFHVILGVARLLSSLARVNECGARRVGYA